MQLHTKHGLVRIIQTERTQRMRRMFLRLAWAVGANGHAFIGFRRLDSGEHSAICAIGAIRF